jgi:hypothetical protein
MKDRQQRGGEAMQPDERLDDLLSQRQHDGGLKTPAAIEPVAGRQGTGGDWQEESTEVNTLLHAADRFAVWGGAEPSPVFADHLEAQLLARFVVRSQNNSALGVALSPLPWSDQGTDTVVGNLPGDGKSGLNGSAPATPLSSDDHDSVMRTPRRLRVRGSRPLSSTFLWRAAAAALLLIVLGTGGVAVAAANAAPGQALYAVRRVEQDVRTTLASSPAERVRLHLQYAQDALTAFDTEVTSRAGEQAYHDALATFADEEQDASAELDNVPAGTERAILAAEVVTLRARGRQDVHAALASVTMSWPLRAEATHVLNQLGESVLAVAQATISGSSQHGAYLWTITIEGSGFASDAVVLVDDQPKGTIVSRATTTLVAQVAEAALRDGTHTIGVGNPDGTVALVLNVATNRAGDGHGGGQGGHGSDDGGGKGSPTPQATSSSDDHGGSGGNGGTGGSSGGSSTPTPTSTPDDHH